VVVPARTLSANCAIVVTAMIEAQGLTDPGRKRKGNEDSLRLDPGLGFAVVADGMGGHQSGEVASQLAVQTLQEFVARAHRDRELTWPFGLDPHRSFEANCLHTGIKLANRLVYRTAASREELTGMGTTIVAALVRNGRLFYAGIGDSRVYLLRENRLRQLTRDDSWIEAAIAQQLIDAAERDVHPFRHVLTKAVGLQEDVDFDVHEESLRGGDQLLLCSDGLTTALSDQKIEEILRTQRENLEEACRALVAAANEAGGPDNVTVVVVRAQGA
jgi:serine/threonine protein phosphatase PrpC